MTPDGNIGFKLTELKDKKANLVKTRQAQALLCRFPSPPSRKLGFKQSHDYS